MFMTKVYKFARTKDIKYLPQYVLDYVFEDEKILIVYTTTRNHGVFTDKKFILFDNNMSLGQRREIITIPYDKMTALSIIYYTNHVELKMFLNNSGEIILKFLRTIPTDKMRLRYLYAYISRVINNQKVNKEDLEKLINNDFKI